MSVMDVCRLCSVKEDLVWLFDETLGESEKMREIIFITTGVEIGIYDIVSQKICEKCLGTTFDIFEFRKKCIENDKNLKEKSGQYLRSNNTEIPNTNAITKKESCELVTEDSPSKTRSRPTIKMHTSVRNLFQMYPGIKLPTISLSCHVAPLVHMPTNEVEDYFKSKNKDLNEYIEALRFKEISPEKTSQVTASDNGMSSDDSVASISEKNGNKNNIVRPIKIKLTPSKSRYEIVNNDDNENMQMREKIKINISRRLQETNTAYSVASKSTSHQKRKFPEHSEMEHIKEPTLIDSLGLIPKVKINDLSTNTKTASTFSSPEKSTHEYICSICNAVKYNARDFKKHQNKHLRCPYCRKRHRYLENKMQHIERCLYKEAMDNLPSIEIDKIENNLKVRRKYPAAFSNFPPLARCDNFDDPTVLKSISTIHSNQKHSGRATANNQLPVEHITAENSMEIVEIVSDSEDLLTLPENLSTHDNVNNVCIKNETAAGQENARPSCSSHIANKFSQRNVTDNVGLMDKPHIKIKGSTILESLDPKASDLKVLKELLSNYKSLKLFTEECTQTDMPTNENILINHHDVSVEFTNLQQYMHSYKIPVHMTNGLFSVHFNNFNDVEQPKRLYLWNDLTPIDVKKNAKITSDGRMDEVGGSKMNHCSSTIALPQTSPHITSTEHSLAEDSHLTFSSPVNDHSSSNSASGNCDTSSINSDTIPLSDDSPPIIRIKKLWELT